MNTMRTLPSEVYEEDFVQIPIDTPRRVVEKAMQGVQRAQRNKDCGRGIVGVSLFTLAGLFVKHNLESPIGIIEVEMIIFISFLIYCLAICIVAGDRNLST